MVIYRYAQDISCLNELSIQIKYAQHLNALEVLKGCVCASDSVLVAEIHVQLLNTLEVHKGRVRDGGLAAVHHVQHLNALEVLKGCICDCGLVAPAHVQLLNALEVLKGCVCDGGLVAGAHVQSLDAPEVHKGCICDLRALAHNQRPQPHKVHKVCIRHWSAAGILVRTFAPMARGKHALYNAPLYHSAHILPGKVRDCLLELTDDMQVSPIHKLPE